MRYSGATGNGSSWANASGDLQAMINESLDDDQIWVAAGVYTPVRPLTDLNTTSPGNRNNAFAVTKNISIYGGFAGHESSLDERNLQQNTTVLSGKSGEAGLYHVLIFANGSEAILDGFTVEGGHADGNESVQFNGKTFRQDAGGGICVVHASPRLNNLTVKDNEAVHGGGIYSFHSFPVLSNMVISHNTAEQGGGIYSYYSFPNVVNATVSQNTGGGFYNVVSRPELTNSVVWGNGDDIFNDMNSRTDYTYSLVQNEVNDTGQLENTNDTSGDNAGAYLYVSPNGNDASNGAENSPLATLAGARNRIREIKATAGLPAGGITVYFRGGVYPVTETTFLREEDSGTESAPIVYRAYPGETPLFTGGLYIQGSQFGPVQDAIMRERLSPEVRDKVVCYDLFANGLSIDDLDYSKDFWKQDDLREHESPDFYDNNYFPRRMQVFMDDDALYLARYPNKTAGIFPENPYNKFLYMAEIYGGRGTPGYENEEAWDGLAPVFRVDEPRIRNWRSHEDIIVFGMTGAQAENERKMVKTIDAEKLTVELQSMPIFGLDDDGRVAFENVFEELDRPGEYYIDKNTGMLYLYPVRDLKDATVKIALLDRNFMIDVKDASYITFSGITFELSKGSIFFIRGGQNCTVENCDLKNFGIWGIRVGDNAISPGIAVEAWTTNQWDAYNALLPASVNGFNHRVSGCNFLNTGFHACWIAAGNAAMRESGNMVFENNVIKYSGLIGSTYRSGLSLTGTGITVRNNSFYYCLGQAISGTITDTKIIYNEFCDSPCDMAEDTGTIYLNFLNGNDGVEVRYNFFRDVTNADSRFGIYFGHPLRGASGFDNNAPFKDFSYNVVYNYPSAGYISIISPSTVIGNIFIDCDVAIPYYPEIFDMFKGRTANDVLNDDDGYSTIATFYKSGLWQTPLWQEKYPELHAFFTYMANEKADLQQPMDQIYNNLIVNINKPFHDRNSSLEELQVPASASVDPKYGRIGNNNYIFHDPGFPSVPNRNFQLSQQVAQQFGMDWIDMSRIGSSKSVIARSALPVTNALVSNETELREALADGTVDAILFANDITLSRSELIIRERRAKPGLVIDGNGYTLTEFLTDSHSAAIRLRNKGDIQSITLRSLTVKGRNGAGTVCIDEAEGVDLVCRNVTYKGPKLAENPKGSIMIDNCDIHIAFADGGGYMGEAVRANQIRFKDEVKITKEYDSDGTMEAVFKLTGANPSFIVETFARGTLVIVNHKGLEVAEDRFTGGGGAIDADNPFDFIVGSNAGIAYKGIYQFLSGAQPASILENWNSTISIDIDGDEQRGVVDKILPVLGDVLVGSASSIGISVTAPAQCLMEVGGHFDMRPGSFLWLGGFMFDPTVPGIEDARYPILLMKGGANSSISFDRPTELFIASQHTAQEWMRAIGFLEDGVIRFTANELSLVGRNPAIENAYKTGSDGYITVEAHVKGGIDGVTQSLSYQTTDDAPVTGGALNEESVNLKNIARMILTSDWDQLGLDAGVFVPRGDPFVEPVIYSPGIGNLDYSDDPLFQDAPAGDFRVKKESPLIDAGNSQSYIDFMNLYLLDAQKDIAGNTRIFGNAIDIGAYEYDPSDTGNKGFVNQPDNLTVWTQQGVLYVRPENAVKLSIYSVSGLMLRKVDVKAGQTAAIPLFPGIYMVVPDSGQARKVIVW